MKRALLFALALTCGCKGELTEVVLAIDQSGINVGRDIDTIHIELGASKQQPDSFYSVGVALCAALPTSGCHDLPLTATLIPGGSMPTDDVRVEVQAKLHGDGDNGIVRITDVATFHFTHGQSLRLELVLTPNCLDDPLRCSEVESSCDQSGCYNPMLEPLGADLSIPRDLAPARDLAGVDLAGVDMTCVPSCPAGYCGIDKNGCGTACSCDSNSFMTCGAGMMCTACGADNQSCCPSTPRCQSSGFACDSSDSTGTCVTCLNQGSSCSTGGQPCCFGSTCNGSTCVRCGQSAGDPCCDGSVCGADLTCINQSCQACGDSEMACCHNNEQPPCGPDNLCVNGPPSGSSGGANDHCAACGNSSQPCCAGTCSDPVLYSCDINGDCSTCGSSEGAPCCQGGVCTGALDCQSNQCQLCGQLPGGSCCPNGNCATGMVCSNSSCQPPPLPDMSMGRDMMMQKGLDGGACGSFAEPCCSDTSPPHCTSAGVICNQGGGPPGICTSSDVGDGGTCPSPSDAMQGEPCCYGDVPGQCAPFLVCCGLALGCVGTSGLVSVFTCYQAS